LHGHILSTNGVALNSFRGQFLLSISSLTPKNNAIWPALGFKVLG
jgi:hypothetical protein